MTSPSVASVSRRRDRRDEERRRAGAGRVAEEAVAVGPLAGQGHEQLARLDQPGVDGGAADRPAGGPEELPPVSASSSAAVRAGTGRVAGAGDDVARARRRPVVGHGSKCRTGIGHRGRRDGRGCRGRAAGAVIR